MNEILRQEINHEMEKAIRLVATASLAVTHLQTDRECTQKNLARAELDGDYPYARILLTHEESEIRMLEMWRQKLAEGQSILVATSAMKALGKPLPAEILRGILYFVFV